MAAYNKLIAAVLGLAVLAAARYGIDLSQEASMATDAIVSLLTIFGVYQVQNKAVA